MLIAVKVFSACAAVWSVADKAALAADPLGAALCPGGGDPSSTASAWAGGSPN
jgi:hypothetical protein